jgi:YggT family protein
MSISSVISIVAELLFLALIIRAVLSWLTGVVALQPIARFFNRVTDPILEPIRRIVPPLGGIDMSPLIAMLVIWLVESLLLTLLAGH